jgi:hypothetical protein
VAACFNNGDIIGIQAGPDVVSPRKPLGNFPQALATVQGTLLEAEAFDRVLRQMRLEDFATQTTTNTIGPDPHHVFVADPYLYVVNSGDATLQVLVRTGDAGPANAGLPLDAGEGEVSFGPNTFPQAVAKLGTNLYVTLSGTGTNGGAIVEVSIANPSAPVLSRTFSLSSSSLDLMPFDGGVTYARPAGIVSYRGNIYAGLNNLDIAFNPAGPGMLAKLDVDAGTLSPIYLPSGCLNTYWLVVSGEILYVSCGGRFHYEGSTLVSVDSSGLVAVMPDGGMVSWNGSCSVGCIGPAIQKFAVVNDRQYLGDQLGRIFVLQYVDGGFVERRGYDFVAGGPPINGCPADGGYALVSDVIAIP